MTERIRVGVVGCGAIAQMMHLPHLRELSDRFQLVAVCDIDRVTLDLVADHYGVARRHTRYQDLVAEAVDLVMVLSSGDHTPAVLAALDAGRDVFVEKPLAYTLRATDAIQEAVTRSNRVLMVGMMKRFDPGYLRARTAIGTLRDLRYVEARTLNPHNSLYMSHHPILGPRPARPVQTAEPVYGTQFDQNAVARILRREPVGLLEEATGSSRPDVLAAYVLLIGSAVHDINALVGILGPPRRVLSAALWAGGTSFSSTLAFAGGVLATYSWLMLPYLKHYQEDFSFYASDGRVHIRFPSPYLRNAPTPIEIEQMNGEELHVTRIIASYEEAFKIELLHLYDCVVECKQPLTDAASFRTDLEILTQIARSFG